MCETLSNYPGFSRKLGSVLRRSSVMGSAAPPACEVGESGVITWGWLAPPNPILSRGLNTFLKTSKFRDFSGRFCTNNNNEGGDNWEVMVVQGNDNQRSRQLALEPLLVPPVCHFRDSKTQIQYNTNTKQTQYNTMEPLPVRLLHHFRTSTVLSSSLLVVSSSCW